MAEARAAATAGAGFLSIRRGAVALTAAAVAAAWIAVAVSLWDTSVPDVARQHVDVHKYFSPTQLSEGASFERFLIVNGLLAQVALLVVLAFYARDWRRFARESAAGRIGTGLLLGMLAFALVWIAQLPFGIAGLAWERHWGVSREGYFEYAFSSWLSLGGEFLFISAAIAIVMALARPLRRLWWVAAVPVFTGLVLLFTFLSPYLTPDLKRLKDPQLRAEAAALARKQGVPGTKVSVLDVHEFTTAPNAEALGFGSTKRVVLWDTLVRKPFQQREISVVIAHELGHLKAHHLLKGVALYGLFALPLAFAIALATRGRGGMYEPGAVPLALLVLAILQFVSTPVQNAFVSRWETEADWLALEATADPAGARSALVRLATTSRSRPDPPGYVHLLLDTHPTILQRIELTKAWEKERGR